MGYAIYESSQEKLQMYPQTATKEIPRNFPELPTFQSPLKLGFKKSKGITGW